MIRDMVPAITALRMKRDEACQRVRAVLKARDHFTRFVHALPPDPIEPVNHYGEYTLQYQSDSDLELVSSTQICPSDMHALLDLNADISRLS